MIMKVLIEVHTIPEVTERMPYLALKMFLLGLLSHEFQTEEEEQEIRCITSIYKTALHNK